MTKQTEQPVSGCYRFKLRAGIGDISWVYSKLKHLDRPLDIEIATELPGRPNRSGPYLDQLPRVAGWRYSTEKFTVDPYSIGHPICAAGKLWQDLHFQPDVLYPLECNRWLESGGQLADWLPDLPTDYHYAHDHLLPRPQTPERPQVLLHFAGWTAVRDVVWEETARALLEGADVSVVTGSYDVRTDTLVPRLQKNVPGLTYLIDWPWPDLFEKIRNADLVVGHASGLTAIAAVVSTPTVCVFPPPLENMVRTFSDPEDRRPGRFMEMATEGEFASAVMASCSWLSGGKGRWPIRRLPSNPISPSALGRYSRPLTVVSIGRAAVPACLAVLSGALDAGVVVSRIVLHGGAHPAELKLLEMEAARSSRPAKVELHLKPELPDGQFDIAVVPMDHSAALADAKKLVPALVGQIAILREDGDVDVLTPTEETNP